MSNQESEIEESHEVKVTKHLTASLYLAQCSCGWVGNGDMPTKIAAERDGDDHVLALLF